MRVLPQAKKKGGWPQDECAAPRDGLIADMSVLSPCDVYGHIAQNYKYNLMQSIRVCQRDIDGLCSPSNVCVLRTIGDFKAPTWMGA